MEGAQESALLTFPPLSPPLSTPRYQLVKSDLKLAVSPSSARTSYASKGGGRKGAALLVQRNSNNRDKRVEIFSL